MADKKCANQIEDQELNDLLDSALKDFNKEEKSDKEDVQKTDTFDSTADKKTTEILEDAWTKDFIKEAADQFEENLQNFIKNGTENELGASVKKMAETIASVITDDDNNEEDSMSADFESAIARAINDVSATCVNLQSETDLSEMLDTILPNAMIPLMQGMVQHLLLKEILYPPLQEVIDKYPEWLEEKKATISANDLQRFTKQLELLRQIRAELEKEKDDDPEEIKKKRSETIISLLIEVEGCGQLPEELVGEQTTPFQIDAEGNPIIPGLLRGMESPQNCCLM